MQTAEISDYQSHLTKYHQQVMDNHDPLRVANPNGDVIILSGDAYKNLMESLYILKDEMTIKSLLKTRQEVALGTFEGTKVKDAFKDIVES